MIYVEKKLHHFLRWQNLYMNFYFSTVVLKIIKLLKVFKKLFALKSVLLNNIITDRKLKKKYEEKSKIFWGVIITNMFSGVIYFDFPWPCSNLSPTIFIQLSLNWDFFNLKTSKSTLPIIDLLLSIQRQNEILTNTGLCPLKKEPLTLNEIWSENTSWFM